MKRGQAVKISAGQDHSFGNMGLIEGSYRISGKNSRRVIGREALAY
jgi:hypothetical protein